MNSLKIREFPESNYRSIWLNGKTMRIALDPSKPISELKYPEFYDVKVTGKCLGKCPWCYQDSKEDDCQYDDILTKVRTFFGSMDKNQKPFQVALGGGEPTEHPDFTKLLQILKEELDICPNYTTNGMWIEKDPYEQWELIESTLKYCGGVAVSCHPHLEKYWRKAAEIYSDYKIQLNFHIIISDKQSVDNFVNLYNEWKDKVDYFVLLPYSPTGRAKEKEIDWNYLVSSIDKTSKQIAFGANFYPYLKSGDLKEMNISMYEPEIMSKYITLEGSGKMYNSSFGNEVIKENLF